MLERLLEYERDWFFAINGAHAWWLDRLMLAFASVYAWSPLLLVPLYFVWKRRAEWIPMAACTALTILLNWLVTAMAFKPFFMRFRPTSHPAFMDTVRVLDGYVADGDFGFISGHSTNAFAFAALSALAVRNRWYSVAIFLWAALMGYSRIYLGAHFISDVVPGIFAGTLIGLLLYLLYGSMRKKEEGGPMHGKRETIVRK